MSALKKYREKRDFRKTPEPKDGGASRPTDGPLFVIQEHGASTHHYWALVHAKPGGDEDAWLLVKMDDEKADARRDPVGTQPESVLTGRTLAEVEEGEKEEEAEEDEELHPRTRVDALDQEALERLYKTMPRRGSSSSRGTT